MKFAFNTFLYSSFPTLLPTYTLDETIRSIAEAGYDAVEIGCCAPHAWPQHLAKDRRKEIRAIADAEGLDISALLPAIGGGFGCNPCSSLRAERQATVSHYIDIIDLASDLGVGMVLYIGGWRAQGMSPEIGWDYSTDCLRQIAIHAQDRGITIAIEPTTSDTNLIDTPADARRMMEAVETSNVKLMFDTFHMDFEGGSFAAYIADMGADLVNIHVADTQRKAIGEGTTDWLLCMEALVTANYTGHVTVETGFGHRGAEPGEVARESLRHLRLSKLSCLSERQIFP
ncbi:MAG: sugar phosphate isomerase/epimerase family protein [Shinella zoogloeoides]|uniref:sugar phosphate isomerase/epimerase family protein n=1 Tax=Shinella zoogloeoides TaxID=352475 RepID=UPI003C7397BC